RAMATLLHGNEPSGLFAIHRWLLEQHTPEVNLLFLLGGVHPAKVPPILSLRQLPDGRDLNRCFKEPFDGEEGAIARAMLAELQTANPECLLDVLTAISHNRTENIKQRPLFAIPQLMNPQDGFIDH
ncbi:MAG: hypothetical protein R6T87_05375, partial [Marinobacter sp.]